MDVMAVLAIVNKVILVANTLIQAGQSAEPAITALINFAKGIKKGPITPEEIAKTDAILDALISQFNEELPDLPCESHKMADSNTNSRQYDDLLDYDDELTASTPRVSNEAQPPFQIYEGSRIAVGKGIGIMVKRKLDAAKVAYDAVNMMTEEIFRYYNHHHGKINNTPRGVFKRGDASENVIFSNLNVMLPAVYSKNPDITCSTTDEGDEDFLETLEALINALFKRKDGLNAKPRIKKGAGMGLLTNFGIIKLGFTQKSDSREVAMREMERITDELGKAKKQQDVDRLYGELEALERNMEVLEPSGFGLTNVLPHRLIVDPNAEQPDGLDAGWMLEEVYFQTSYLTARFTQSDEEDDPDDTNRKLIYKPTHKARFTAGNGAGRDDGLGLVMDSIDKTGNEPTSFTEDERTAYINMYYTKCFYYWEKATRRLMLFHSGDWTWPIWVWDDPLGLTRFYPYFIISFAMSTGGTVSVGETAYVLDHQDEVNDIARQKSRIRRSIFDYFFYNSSKFKKDEVEKFIRVLRGETSRGKHAIGVDAGEMKISDVFESLMPPSGQHEKMFEVDPVLASINRITNTSDALRGVQFKTNTTEDAVQSYMESLKLSVGAKVDVIEDVVADIALAVAEIAVQFMDEEQVAGLVGPYLAQFWQQMTVEQFHADYDVELVAGSMEKPTSIFKKKEAIDVTTAVGQFASAAPGSTLTIMLKVLSKAFTEVVIKPEDWAALKAEIQANLQRGVSTQGGQGAPQVGQQPPNGQDGGTQMDQNGGGDIRQAALQLPDPVKQKVMQLKQGGASDDQIRQFVTQQVQANQNPADGGGRQRTQANGSAQQQLQ
jgi:hypothetical protein